MRYLTCLALFASSLALLATHARAAEPAANFPVTIRVDAAQTRGELKPIYRFFGADEPNYAYMKDGKKLLRDIGASVNRRNISARTVCSSPAMAHPR
jgi:xylan 1,4-beta-xylosidase